MNGWVLLKSGHCAARAQSAAGRAGGHHPQAVDGHFRGQVPTASQRAGGGGAHAQGPEAHRPVGRARHHLPVRWPERRGRHAAPRPHEQDWRQPVAPDILVRPRPPGRRSGPRRCDMHATANWWQDAWRGKAENVPAAKAAFSKRAHLNGLASKGEYSPELEK